MKLCFSTLGCTENSLEASLALAMSRNIGNIELRGIGGVLDNRKISDFLPENAENTSALFEKYGVRPTVLGTSCSFHDKNKHEANLSEGISASDIAARFAIPYLRVFGNSIVDGDLDASAKAVAEGIGELCHRVDRSVIVLLEVHGDFNRQTTLEPVFSRLSGVENFGIIWDIAHSDRAYGDSWQEFYAFVKPLVRHIHIKDLRRADKALTLVGDGDIPIRNIVDRLLSDGFDGCFSLEWEKKWHPELPPLETALDGFIGLMKKGL